MSKVLDTRKTYLDDLYRRFDHHFIDSDPILLVKSFPHSLDREIVAVITSAMAFGQVSQILKAVRCVIELMSERPAEFVANLEPAPELERWKQFYYRMIKPSDILRLLFALRNIIHRHGSLAEWVYSHYAEEDTHLGITWAKCVEEIRRIDRKHWKWKRSHGIGFRHLLPDPNKNGACKRVHLLLRWMVRKDSVDLGLWDRLPTSKLIMPVDTHIQRIAYNIGLTDRSDSSFKTANEITDSLRRMDPVDPVKFDFALCRLGILDLCPKKRDIDKCRACSLYNICRL